ncbi:hypothetical protein BGW38_010813 [Lunasporangiospora selenospora]|uniref:Hydrophobin n=1 Tax=Lunasporangiospora selenospora TaxID=979761 RepID=A0A9P6KIM8_9FUNG|nr:hypothetical protein BGW38_010813 [Lunasporangiospora selenospora]
MKISLPLTIIATVALAHAAPHSTNDKKPQCDLKKDQRPADQQHIVFRDDEFTNEFYCYKMIIDKLERPRHRCDDPNTLKCCETIKGGVINHALNCHIEGEAISHKQAKQCCVDQGTKAIIVDKQCYGVPH